MNAKKKLVEKQVVKMVAFTAAENTWLGKLRKGIYLTGIDSRLFLDCFIDVSWMSEKGNVRVRGTQSPEHTSRVPSRPSSQILFFQ